MCIAAASRILEGERYYGEQTLATRTLQRLQFLRGVVNMVIVCVKVQGAKSNCFSEILNSCLWIRQKLICAKQKQTDSVFHYFVMTRIAFHKSKRLPSTEQWHANNKVFGDAPMCWWWAYKTHVFVVTFLIDLKYVAPTIVSATSASYAVKTDRRL